MKHNVRKVVVEILVGLPASGKSTYAKEKAKDSKYVHLTSDGIREEFDYNISNNKVFSLMESRMFACLKRGVNVIYDATNLNSKRRKALIDKIRHFEKKHSETLSIEVRGRIFAHPLTILFNRNKKRTGRACVPEEVILRMFKQFQIPMEWEGFDNIIVDPTSSGAAIPIGQIINMEQDNPHHHQTLSEHLIASNNYGFMCGFSTEVIAAAMYHDIGKVVTKEFDDKGIAHYYNHENAGAYMLLLHFLKFNTLEDKMYLHIIGLVNYHMRPYVWKKNEKVLDRDIAKFGLNFAKELWDVHSCDVYSH